MEYYVYELIDPRDLTVFYVGKGKRWRLYQHEKEARSGKFSPKCAKIREILAAGHSIKYNFVKYFGDEAKAYAFEAKHIKQIGLENLTNLAPGGVGVRFVQSPEKMTRSTINGLIRSMAGWIRRGGFHGREMGFVLGGQWHALPPEFGDLMKSWLFKISRSVGFEEARKEFAKYNILFDDPPIGAQNNGVSNGV